MMRFFEWRNYYGGGDDGNDGTAGGGGQGDKNDDDNSNRKENRCLREEHALWACRAIATGCGSTLVELRTCLNDQGKDAALSTPAAYDGDHGGDNCDRNNAAAPTRTVIVPCGDVQRRLASCVAAEARDLRHRANGNGGGD